MCTFKVMTYLIVFSSIRIHSVINWCVSNTQLPHVTKLAFATTHAEFVYLIGGYITLYNYTSGHSRASSTFDHPIYKYPIQSILSCNYSSIWEEVPGTHNTDQNKYLSYVHQSVVHHNKVYLSNQFGGLIIFDLKDESYIDVGMYNERISGIYNYDHCSVIVNSIIYVIGGRSGRHGSINTYAINSTQIYDINNDEWCLLSPEKSLNIARWDLACVYSNIDGNIYVFNGAIGIYFYDFQYTNSIEILAVNSNNNLQKNGWKLLSDTFDIPMAGMIAIEYHSFIYILGGFWGIVNKNMTYTNQVRKFDVTTRRAVIDSYLVVPLAYFGILIYQDTIMTFGGVGSYPLGSSNDFIQIGQLNVTQCHQHKTTVTLDSAETTMSLTAIYQTARNEKVYLVSIIVAISACSMILVAVLYVISYSLIYVYKKHTHKFISNRPGIFIYCFSAIADIIIQFGMYWWIIKAWITFNPFGDNIKHYCDGISTHKNTSYSDSDCDMAILCSSKSNVDYPEYPYCEPSSRIGIIYWFWTGYAPIHFFVEICIFLYFFKNKEDFLSDICCHCHRDYFLFCFYCKHGVKLFEKAYQFGPHSKEYLNRIYWGYIGCGCKQMFICENIIYYTILIFFGWRYTDLIDVLVYPEIVGLDFYLVLGLIMIKMGLQIGYIFGKTYDATAEEMEKQRFMLNETRVMLNKLMNVLRNRFNDDTAWIIAQYLPIYY
eukprot:499760_1